MDIQSDPDGETLFVVPERPEETGYPVPEVAVRVEAIAPVYRRGLAEPKPDRQNRLRIRPWIVKQIVRSREAEGASPTHRSRCQAGSVLSGEEMSLDTDPEQVRTDAALWIGFFVNYNNGFLGDVPRQQSDCFAFMCWFQRKVAVCSKLRWPCILWTSYWPTPRPICVLPNGGSAFDRLPSKLPAQTEFTAVYSV